MPISKTATTDQAVLEELGTRLRENRLERNMSQADLAAEAGIGRVTLQRLEEGQSGSMTSFVRVLRALDLLNGIDALIPEKTPSPIEEMRQRGRQRKRAGSPPQGDSPRPGSRPWRWGDEGGA
jgi:transcriptional regulator with XRE-family HTH domain